LAGYDLEILEITAEDLRTFTMTVPAVGEERLYISTETRVSWNAKTHRFRFIINNGGQDSLLTLLGYGIALELGREDRESI
jgi:hypothetical protein